MVSLSNLGEKFKRVFLTELGVPFRATIMPIEDGKIYDDDFYVVRQIIRVTPTIPIVAGMVVFDDLQRPFLLGRHDQTEHYTSFRAYPCSHQALWQREETEVDAITGLARGTKLATIGTPWVLSEQLDKEGRSGDIKTREDMRRVLTGHNILLDDVVDGFVVKRINVANGIKVLEVV